jgi:hypothetical protein
MLATKQGRPYQKPINVGNNNQCAQCPSGTAGPIKAADRSENAQVAQIKALLAEIETDIQDQLKRVK